MKNLMKFTIAITLFFVVMSCYDMYKGCKNMPEQNIGTGEIINNAIVSDLNVIPKIDYIITSDSQNVFYISSLFSDSVKVFNLTVSFDNGSTYQPIDFSRYSVLGKYTDGDCRVVFDRNVTKNVESKKYIYKIIVISCGSCEKLGISMNWVLIPKIEDDFFVEFIVEDKRWKE